MGDNYVMKGFWAVMEAARSSETSEAFRSTECTISTSPLTYRPYKPGSKTVRY